ncbi:MAG: hypothetical protein ACO3M2_12940 [Pseudohongiellaceae bacterium]
MTLAIAPNAYVIRIYCGMSVQGESSASIYNNSYDIIMELADYWFGQGCTVYSATGIWMNGEEEMMIIEYVADREVEAACEAANQLAIEYKNLNMQDAVLVTVDQTYKKIL